MDIEQFRLHCLALPFVTEDMPFDDTVVVFRLKGKGIPYLRGGGRGDEFVTVKVVTPKNLNKEQKELLHKLGESFGDTGIPKKKGLFGL